MSNIDIDALLEQTQTRPAPVRPPMALRPPLMLTLREWAGSNVAAYRVGLVASYVAMTYFGATSFVAGIPVFAFTAPEGYTPFWAGAVILGGLVAGFGAIRAGAEPITKEIKVFNAIELTGAILLAVALGTYAAILLIIGYWYDDTGRQAVGSGFIALGIHPAVRVLWLIFRPRFLKLAEKLAPKSAPFLLIPAGHALFTVDMFGVPQKLVASSPTTPEAIDVPSLR